MMCGYKICLLVKGMQNDLNACKLILVRKFECKNGKKEKSKGKAYKKFIYANNEHLHQHQKKYLLYIQCLLVEKFNVPHMGCIL